jgi:hypothetical protein
MMADYYKFATDRGHHKAKLNGALPSLVQSITPLTQCAIFSRLSATLAFFFKRAILSRWA